MSLLLFAALAWGANNLHYPVRCANQNDCPPWVAGLRMESSVCTAILVGPDLMLTNRHCLPERLQRDGADCRDHVSFFFPKSKNHPAQKFDCERVQHISNELSDQFLTPDFVFLRLKEDAGRPAVPYSRDGLPDQTNFRIYVMDPENEGGVLRMKTCEATQNTVVNPYYTNSLSPIVTFARCSIQKGNSGSPIIASDGTLRGILNSRSEIAAGSLALAKNKGTNAQSAHGTNLSCLEKDVLDSAVPDAKACSIKIDGPSQQALSKKMIEEKVEAAIEELIAKVNESGRKLLSMDRAFFAWNPKNFKDEGIRKQDRSYLSSVRFEPRCLVPNVKRIEDVRNRLKKSTASFLIESPSYDLHQGLDDDLRFRVEVRETKIKERVSLIPLDLLRKKDIEVRMERQSPGDSGTNSSRTILLDLCWQARLRNRQQ
jgi:hypothetical protein